jgi:hypothetical protein
VFSSVLLSLCFQIATAKDESFDGTPLGWPLYGWGESPPGAEPAGYFQVIALLVAAGGTVGAEWLNEADRGFPLVKSAQRFADAGSPRPQRAPLTSLLTAIKVITSYVENAIQSGSIVLKRNLPPQLQQLFLRELFAQAGVEIVGDIGGCRRHGVCQLNHQALHIGEFREIIARDGP